MSSKEYFLVDIQSERIIIYPFLTSGLSINYIWMSPLLVLGVPDLNFHFTVFSIENTKLNDLRKNF